MNKTISTLIVYREARGRIGVTLRDIKLGLMAVRDPADLHQVDNLLREALDFIREKAAEVKRS